MEGNAITVGPVTKGPTISLNGGRSSPRLSITKVRTSLNTPGASAYSSWQRRYTLPSIGYSSRLRAVKGSATTMSTTNGCFSVSPEGNKQLVLRSPSIKCSGLAILGLHRICGECVAMVSVSSFGIGNANVPMSWNGSFGGDSFPSNLNGPTTRVSDETQN